MPTIPSDPLFAQQWYLHNLTPGELDLNVVDVWDDYTGFGVRVTVIDSGADLTHADYDANLLTNLDYDYANGDFTPPLSNHGTSVVGIIAAEQGNGIGGVGIAWDSQVNVMSSHGIYDSYRATAYLDAAGLGDGIGNTNGNANGADIITNSGGAGSDVFNTDPDIAAAVVAYETVSDNGRGGLGTILVKSSGNSRAPADSTSREEGTAEGHDTNRFMINVAALRADGWVTGYSTPGANVLVSAFADTTANQGGIVTTDVTGTGGYNTNTTAAGGDYTDVAGGSGFNGTSAAAPQVAGVIALMLEANDQLGWRDVQSILAYSAVHVGSAVGTAANTGAPANGTFEQATQADGSSWFWNAADNWNGGGMHFSNDYGYGLVDALAAVRLAETWTLQSTSANDTTTFEDDVNTEVTIDIASQTYTINEATSQRMEHVSIDLDFATTYLSDVEIFLTSPSGTRVQLIADTGDSADFDGRWTFGTTAFMGEDSAGDWILEVNDDAGGDPLTIRDADLRTHGSGAISDEDYYIFTNEFSDYAGVAGHVTAFIGGPGSDTMNAAAVSSGTIIDLFNNTGTIDGIAITNADIQVVYTGDGADTITGDSVTDEMHAGRGDDMVIVNDSIDATHIYDGGAGTDTIDWSSRSFAGVTTFLMSGGGAGVYSAGNMDTMTGFENLIGTQGNDDIRGFGNDNNLDGQGGDDLIYGGAGNDTLDGGAHGAEGDTLSFFYDGAGITIDLNNTSAQNTGTGMKTVSNFENVIGSAFGDTITGDASANLLQGVGGDDTFVHQEIGSLANDTIDGGADTDTIRFAGIPYSLHDIRGDTITSIERLEVAGLTFNQSRTILMNADQFGAGISLTSEIDVGFDPLTSEVFVITMGGVTSLDLSGLTFVGLTDRTGFNINGDGSFETITGTMSNDAIQGGFGADTLDGGLGNNALVYDDSTGGVNISLQTGFAFGGHATGDVFSNFQNVSGSDFNDILSGDGGNNILVGGDGDDILRGRGGADDLIGGQGSDTANYSDSAAHVNISLLSGFTGGGAGNHASGDTFNSIENLVGSSYGDFLNGDHNNNIFEGRAGGDFNNGRGGIDTVSYASSNAGVNVSLLTGFAAGGHAAGDSFSSIENLIGSAYDDLLNGSNLANVFEGGAGGDYNNGRGGNDTASYVNSDAGVNVSLLTGFATGGHATGDTLSSIENLTGSDYGDILSGDSGANILIGGNGSDILRGRAGADVLDGGDGFDIANYSDSTAFVNVSLLSGFTGGGAGNHASGDTLISIEDLVGSAFDDLLNGTNLSNYLEGGGGADFLNGRGGTDAAVYANSDAGVNVNLLTGIATGGHAQGDTFSSIEEIIGSSFDDILEGHNTGNALYGEDGDDFLRGGAGGDHVEGGAGSDIASYSDSTAAVNISLTSGFVAGGHAAGDFLVDIEGLQGSAFADILRGNGADNVFEGMAGGDMLFGYSGFDTLSYANSNFGVNVSLASGFASGGHAGGDVHSGFEALIGSAHDDILRGNGVANTLTGNAGTDQLFGYGGADTFVFAVGSDTDQIMDFQNNIDIIEVDAALFGVSEDVFDFAAEAGGNVTFTFTGGDVMQVNGTTILDLQDDLIVV